MGEKEIINLLVNRYHEDEEELKTLSLGELKEILNELEDHSDLYPNGDEDDDSRSWE